MCVDCFADVFGDINGGGRWGRGGGRRGGGLFGHDFDGGIDRRDFARVSNRSMSALSSAKSHFIQHLKTIDTSRGSVTHEIIRFHLVPDVRKQFKQYVQDFGCTATSRQLTREEQDRFNKNRKSLMYFTSVTVTPSAQQAYFANNPDVPKPATLQSTTELAPSITHVASSALNNRAASNTSSTATSTLQNSFDKKTKHKLNEAAVQRAASSTSTGKKIDAYFNKKV